MEWSNASSLNLMVISSLWSRLCASAVLAGRGKSAGEQTISRLQLPGLSVYTIGIPIEYRVLLWLGRSMNLDAFSSHCFTTLPVD